MQFVQCLCVCILQEEFREYPPVLRHAVCVARRLQDPLIEFAQLCNQDEDILCLKYHPMQVKLDYNYCLKRKYFLYARRGRIMLSPRCPSVS